MVARHCGGGLALSSSHQTSTSHGRGCPSHSRCSPAQSLAVCFSYRPGVPQQPQYHGREGKGGWHCLALHSILLAHTRCPPSSTNTATTATGYLPLLTQLCTQMYRRTYTYIHIHTTHTHIHTSIRIPIHTPAIHTHIHTHNTIHYTTLPPSPLAIHIPSPARY